VEPDYDNGRRALFQGRGGGFAAIAAILPWSSTLIRWNDNAGSAKAVNTTNIWGSMRDFFNSGAFGAMLLWGFFILILPTIAWFVLQPMQTSHYYSSPDAIRRRGCCGPPCIQQTLDRNNSPMFAPSLASSIGSGVQNRFFGGLASSFVWLTVIILPVLALILSLHLRLCCSWRDGFVQYSKPFRLLQFIFPFCCAVVFALALLVAIGSVRR
jgi:hypothetical protein